MLVPSLHTRELGLRGPTVLCRTGEMAVSKCLLCKRWKELSKEGREGDGREGEGGKGEKGPVHERDLLSPEAILFFTNRDGSISYPCTSLAIWVNQSGR